MALTVITQETFQGTGTLNAGSPGNLGTVNAGSFIKSAVGPRLTSDTTVGSQGWSADLRLGSPRSAYHTMNINGGSAASKGCFSCWYYFSSLAYNGPSNPGQLASLWGADTNQTMEVLFKSTTPNFWYNRNGLWVDTDSGVAIPLCQWFELRHSWSAATVGTYSLDYRLSGSATWVNIYSATFTASAIKEVRGGQANNSGSGSTFNGRYGMPTLMSLGTYATDFHSAVPSQVDPPTTPTSWYINSGGNDSNDGTSSGTAILTVGEATTRSQYSGFIGRAIPTAPTITNLSVVNGLATVTATAHGRTTGDVVIIDGALPVWFNGDVTITVTDANHFTYTIPAPPPINRVPSLVATGTQTATGSPTARVIGYGDTLVMDNTVGGIPVDYVAATQTISTQGLRLQITGSPKLHRTLPNSGWTQYNAGTYPNIWQTTDSSATDLLDVAVWENDKWLNHPAGASIAAVAATLNGYTTIGGFWTDGTTLYLNPSNNTNPNSDGKTYTRSRFRSGGGALQLSGTDIDVVGDGTTRFWKTALIDNTNAPVPNYPVQFVTIGGACRLKSLIVDYFATHGIGSTGDGSNCMAVRSNITYGQGPPWGSTGQATQDVDYSNAGSNMRYQYVNCGSTVSVGVVGSTAGAIDSNHVASWVSHGGAVPTPINGGYFLNCTFVAGFSEQSFTSGTIYIQGGTSGGGLFSCNLNVNQHQSSGDPFSVHNDIKTLTHTNSLQIVTTPPTVSGGIAWQPLAGTLNKRGVTTDLRGNAKAAGQASALYAKDAAAASGTNLVVDGTLNTKVTSATYNFTANDVNNVLVISAAAGWTPGVYTILSVASNAATLSASPAAVGTTGGVWSEVNFISITIQDCVFLVDNAKDFTLLNGFASTDTIVMDHNAHQLGSGALIAVAYNDGSTTANRTLAQWQALGKGAGSINTTITFGANYRPVAGSPVIGLGPNQTPLGGLPDFLGTFRPGAPYNVDAGAVQAGFGTRILVNPVNGN